MTVTSSLFPIFSTAVASTYSAGPAYVSGLLSGDFVLVQEHSFHVHTQVYDGSAVPFAVQHQIDFGQLDVQGPTALLGNTNIVVLTRDVDSIGFTIQNYAGDAVARSTTDIGDIGSFNGRVTALSNGGFVIVYTDQFSANDTDIHATTYDSAGNIQASINVDRTAQQQDHPSVCALVGGGFAIAWESAKTLRIAIYDDSGAIRVVKTALPSSGVDLRPAIVALADGGFAIAYETDKFSSGDSDIALARYNSQGGLVYDKQVYATPSDDSKPSISLLANGVLAIGATVSPTGGASQAVLGLVDSLDGQLLGSDIINFSGVSQDNVSVSTLSDGRLVAVSTGTDGVVSGAIYDLSTRNWFGDFANDRMTGGTGRDYMFGDAGDDSLFGGDGDDTLVSADGNDLIIAGNGNNWIYGGVGLDTMDFRFDSSGVTIDMQEGLATHSAFTEADQIYSIENLILGSGGDFVLASDASNRISAALGDDTIYAAFGLDTVMGGSGNDLIYGGGQADSLDGGVGNDTLDGGVNNDILIGGTGQDSLLGGSGADIFRFNKISESGKIAGTLDLIGDFDAGTATTASDLIDLRRIDAIKGGALDHFVFVNGAFTAAGQVNAVQQGADVVISLNTAGTSVAEMSILLTNVSLANIDASDFMF